MQYSSPNKTRSPTSPSLEMHSPSSVAATTTATTILLILGSVPFSTCYSQEAGRYYTCLQDFSCGQTIQKVRYPFWGDGRPQFCGHPSFELKCQNNEYPTIEIDNRAFRVHDIHPSSKTITLVSSDLWENYCTQELHNITLDDNLFTYGQINRHLFLFYNCTSEARTINIPYNFTCEIGGIERLGLYKNETFFNGIENSQYTTISCNQSVEVQVFRETVDKLLEGSLTLQEGLRRGFEVVYDANKTTCARCQGSGGFCGSNSSEFACHCRDDHTYPATCRSPGRSNFNKALTLGTVVPAAGITVIILFCIIINKLKRSEYAFVWKTKTENYRNIEAFLETCGPLPLERYTYSDVKKITNSFGTKLGQGGFACVFKGKLENGCLVAVKVLKGLKGNGDEFINEVATICRTSHIHIVTLLGFCFEGSHRVLIYEFMPNGSLDKFINDGGSLTHCTKLGREALYQIAVGIARGLEYLHRGCNTRILHFDIKPHNILLNEDFCPKISDFGLAKLCPQKESIISLSGARGTIGYIAPEVFSRNFGGVSHKSDVYSYGMMVLEMVGATMNISVEVDHTSEIYFPHWIYKHLDLDKELGLHGIMDNEANANSRKLIIVGLWCIQTDPSHRPSMSQVVEMLEGRLESLQIPPKPFLSSPPRAPVDSSSPLTS